MPARRARRGFLLRALAFSLPVGIAAAVSTFAAFWIAQTVELVDIAEARTTATVTLFGLGVLVLRLLSRPLNAVRRSLVYGAVVAFLVVATVPALSDFFALHLPHAVLVLAAIGIVAVAGVVMEMAAEALEIRLDPLGLRTRLRRRTWRGRSQRSGDQSRGD